MKKKKILISIIIIIVLIFVIIKHHCGPTSFYIYNPFTKTVTIIGSGTATITNGSHYKVKKMEDRGSSPGDYDSVGELKFPKSTKKIVVCEGITKIINKCDAIYTVEGGTYDNLKEVKLPNSLNELGNGCFANQTSLESINIPDSIKIIPKYAFYNCNKLYNIKLSKNVRVIEPNAFEKCATLLEIKLTNIRYIGQYAFCNCYNLKDVEIDGDIPDLLAYTFDGCFNLRNVKLTDNIKIIEHSAFRNCNYIDRDKIYSNVESPHAYKWNSRERQEELEKIEAQIINE